MTPETVNPDSGEIAFHIVSAPVSLQSTPQRKAAIRELVREQTSKLDFVISGDIQVDIEWLLDERRRYESHVSPDVDNVLKPTLDTLCGPCGVLVDDCEVQAVCWPWIDWTRDEERFDIRIRRMSASPRRASRFAQGWKPLFSFRHRCFCNLLSY